VNGVETPIGGVLSDGAIVDFVADDVLIVKDTFNERSLQPASYDLTISENGLITPGGEKFPPAPGEKGPKRVILYSGDTALFSTKELFRMPCHVSGNVTIKNRLAAEGLTLLSGMIVDPGYGLDERADDEQGCRLFLHVANTGKDPIILGPGTERIARVQFLPLSGRKWDKRPKIKASRWEEQQQASLGFLADLKVLKDKVERTDTRSGQIVLFGFVVLAVALIGACFSSILSIAADTRPRMELRHAFPQSTGQLLLWVLILFAASLFALGLVSVPWKGFRLTQAYRRHKQRNR
jgi:deoxycytidine triphosphate deaminase